MIKSILKKSFSLIMIVMVTFSYFVSSSQVIAASISLKEPQTLGDLKDNLAALKKQKAENDKMEEQAKSDIKQKEAAIKKAEADIQQAEADIEDAEQRIEESNEKIEEFKVATENALRALQQMKSKNAYLEYLSDSASITEFIMRIKAMEQITNSYQKNIEELAELIKQNEQLKVELKNKQDELGNKIPVYQAAIAQLYDNLDEYDEFALDLDTQIKTVQDSVNSYIQLCADSSKSYLGDAELLSDCIDVPYNAGWLKPLTKGIVTSPWGYRYHPTKGTYSHHSGIDIGGVAEGTPIYAAAAGKVSAILEKRSCGGNMVYVDVNVGGVQYTTYYYHLLTINVKTGQLVTQNTIIGTVGGGSTSSTRGGYDTCTTGAHLHFGVMKGFYSGSTPVSRQISPPGFKNIKGYSWTTRTAYAS